MTDILHRPSELLMSLRQVLRDTQTGVNKQIEAVNTSLAERGRRYRVPEFDGVRIDMAFQPESMPEWTEEPTIFIVYLDERPERASPPNLQWADVSVLVQAYLQFDNLIIDDDYNDDEVPETDEATTKLAMLDTLYALRRTADCFGSHGGMWGLVGVDQVAVSQAPLGLHGVPVENADETEGYILQATGGLFFSFGQEGL